MKYFNVYMHVVTDNLQIVNEVLFSGDVLM